ncbi:MAG: 3-isopropylmalate dehydrogenase [Lachnospiraceae bacterium]|jgi:3-isopropylmalate dehydrogenase|nr:3-isopropylmalate dehydrogenase [Lachnospiraceae bacterium]
MKSEKLQIAYIDGDGIGPEIITEARKVLTRMADIFGHQITFVPVLMGGASIDIHGEPLTEEAIRIARSADAVLLGAIGGDAMTSPWYQLPPQLRPEAGLLRLRKELGVFANLRPVFLYNELRKACPLKEEIIGDGFDMIIVRELTGGLYFGERQTIIENGVRKAVDTLVYDENEIRRVAQRSFLIAMDRKKELVSVDKANVLDSSRLWRTVVNEVAVDYPEVKLTHMLVDNCAMQLVMNPGQFDVILTENMFGDILSDEASVLSGSIGMLPSASLGSPAFAKTVSGEKSLHETSRSNAVFGLYEPCHGSAPDIAGLDIANPLAAILSAAMMLRYSFAMEAEATAIETAVGSVLRDGYRTKDIIDTDSGGKVTATGEMGSLVAARIALPQ